MNSYFFAFFISLILGIIFAYYLDIHIILTFLPALAVFLFSKRSTLLIIILLFIPLGFMRMDFSTLPANTLDSIDNISIEGKVLNYPSLNNGRTSFYLLNNDYSNPYQEKIRVVLLFEADVSKGDKVKLQGKLNLPAIAGNPGEFNYRKFLEHEGVYFILSIQDEDGWEIKEKAHGFTSVLNQARERGSEQFIAYLGQERGGILLGMLLGKKEAIEAEQYQSFQRTGIVHVFAVSGLHIGFLLLFCMLISSFLDLSTRDRTIFSILMVLLYASLVGWPVSVSRASVMAIIGLIAYYLGREKNLLNALGIAGLIICLIDPQAVFKVGFQLSFAATFGLIYLYPAIRRKIKSESKMWDMLLVPLAAQLAVVPLIAYHFNLFTPIALISNIFITYLAAFTVILGFMAFIFANLIPFLSEVFLIPISLGIDIIIILVELSKDLPGAYRWVATPSLAVIVIYYLAVAALAYLLNQNSRKQYLVVALLPVFLFIASLYIPAGIWDHGKVELVFIDVGQGDSILIKTPKGKFILVDGGGSDTYDVGEYKLLPYLRHRGINEIDFMINTHPDTDHLRGLESVIREIRVKHIAIPKTRQDAIEFEVLKGLAMDKNIALTSLQRGQSINLEEGLLIKVLHPIEQSYLKDNHNNQSISIMCTYKDFRFFLTGDIEEEAMRSILADASLLLDALIVQVPHHGSKHSYLPEFYKQLDSSYAIISAGRNNRYGHPHDEILDLLDEYDLTVIRTDQHGAIRFISDGKKIEYNTFL